MTTGLLLSQTGKKKVPRVSVVIPTFNRGWIIQEAVESVLAQDFDDFEVIVVDDGSTDDTLDILDAYKDRIHLLRQDNKGVSAARNKGISASSGRFIAFLDTDDLWLPGKLSIQMAFFESHPTALICQTEEFWVRNGVRVNPKHRHKKPSGMIFERSLHLCLVSPSAVMVKRSLLDVIGLFDERLKACEDYDMWLRVSCRYPVYLIDTPLIVKRGGHVDQLSSMPGLDKYRIMSIQKLMEDNLFTREQYDAALKVLIQKSFIYANGCRKRGRDAEADYYEKLPDKYV
jgi:glycosyltransferase involved in cell wall biosynthesis